MPGRKSTNMVIDSMAPGMMNNDSSKISMEMESEINELEVYARFKFYNEYILIISLLLGNFKDKHC